MSGPMPIIQTFLPEKLPGERVQSEPTGSFGEDGFVKSDDAFEDQRVCSLLHVRRFSEMQGSGRVSGSIQVLRARIAEVDRLRINDGAVAWFRLVVNDCRVGAGGGYRIKGQADKVFVFSM